MRVNDEGFTPAGGELIPFDSILKIDKRKWARKGLAYIYYQSGGAAKKARVDGMAYGQFDKDDPNNAENLFQKIESSVTGVEVIDYEEEADNQDQATD